MYTRLWLRKNSFADNAEKMFQQATLENYGQAEMSEWDRCHKKIKRTFSEKVSFETRTYRNTHKTWTFSLPGNA